jgi:hypothetical protein
MFPSEPVASALGHAVCWPALKSVLAWEGRLKKIRKAITTARHKNPQRRIAPPGAKEIRN